jgi:hypothetical protein
MKCGQLRHFVENFSIKYMRIILVEGQNYYIVCLIFLKYRNVFLGTKTNLI